MKVYLFSTNLVFLFLSVLIAACFTNGSANSLSNQVATLELAVFRYAPIGVGDCAAFHDTVGNDAPAGSSAQQVEDNVRTRYQNAVNCFKYLVDNGKIAEANLPNAQKDFDDNNTADLQQEFSSKK